MGKKLLLILIVLVLVPTLVYAQTACVVESVNHFRSQITDKILRESLKEEVQDESIRIQGLRSGIIGIILEEAATQYGWYTTDLTIGEIIKDKNKGPVKIGLKDLFDIILEHDVSGWIITKLGQKLWEVEQKYNTDEPSAYLQERLNVYEKLGGEKLKKLREIKNAYFNAKPKTFIKSKLKALNRPLTGDIIRIGSEEGLEIIDKNLDKKHAGLVLDSLGKINLYIYSEKGFYLNGKKYVGKKYVGKIRLRPGDKVKLGESAVEFEIPDYSEKLSELTTELSELTSQGNFEQALKKIQEALVEGVIPDKILAELHADLSQRKQILKKIEKPILEEELKPEKKLIPTQIPRVPESPLDHANKWPSLVGIIPGLTEELERDFKFGGTISEWDKGEYRRVRSTEGGGTIMTTASTEEEYNAFQKWKESNYLQELTITEAKEELNQLKKLLSKHGITFEFIENLKTAETDDEILLPISAKIKRIRQLLELLPDSILDLDTWEKLTLGGSEGTGGARASAFGGEEKELQILNFALTGPERNLDALVIHESGHALEISLTLKEREELTQLREAIPQLDFFTFDYMLGKAERAGRMRTSLNEFIAESFMHYILQGEQLSQHIENLEKTKPDVGKAYRKLYNVLKQKLGKEYGVEEKPETETIPQIILDMNNFLDSLGEQEVSWC